MTSQAASHVVSDHQRIIELLSAVSGQLQQRSIVGLAPINGRQISDPEGLLISFEYHTLARHGFLETRTCLVFRNNGKLRHTSTSHRVVGPMQKWGVHSAMPTVWPNPSVTVRRPSSWNKRPTALSASNSIIESSGRSGNRHDCGTAIHF